MTHHLELRGISKDYGQTHAVAGISLSVPRGEILGLLGPNGAGKSTTMRTMAGLSSPTSGEILWEGNPLAGREKEWKRSLGVVLEELSLFEHLTVREHLLLMGRLYGLGPDPAVARTDELLDFLQLEEFSDTVAGGASQGTRKKLAFGLALLHSPRTLLLDEAFNGIDAVVVKDLKDLLRGLAGRGVTIILSSHVLDAAETLIDRCVILNHGKIERNEPMERIRAAGRSLEQAYVETVRGHARPARELSWAS
jgi:ABC-2 type transport system ATP-binding protein